MIDPWVGKIPLRREWQPTSVPLPRKFHGWRSLVGYSLWGRKESDTTERLHFHFQIYSYGLHNKPLQVKLLFTHSRLMLCKPMDCSPPGPSVHGILKVRILEWIVMPSSMGSSRHREQTRISCVSCIAGGFFITEPPGKYQLHFAR